MYIESGPHFSVDATKRSKHCLLVLYVQFVLMNQIPKVPWEISPILMRGLSPKIFDNHHMLDEPHPEVLDPRLNGSVAARAVLQFSPLHIAADFWNNYYQILQVFIIIYKTQYCMNKNNSVIVQLV